MESVSVAARNVRLLYAYWFLREFQLWIPVWVVFLTVEQGFSLTEVTVADGLFLVGVVLLEVPTGAVADHWGRSRSLALGALCLGGAVLVFAFTTSFAVLLASFLLWSVAMTLMSGADLALLYDTLADAAEEGRYERIAGRAEACSWAGVGIATLVGAPVATVLDTRATIFIGAATCLVAAGVALALREPVRHQPATADGQIGGIREAFATVWQTREIRAVLLFGAAVTAAIEGGEYLVQPYLQDRGVEIGVLFSLMQVPIVLAGIAGGLAVGMLDRAGNRGLLAIPAVAAVAYLVLALGPGLTAYAVFPLTIGLGSVLLPLTSARINRRVGPERRATILSIQGMAMSFVLACVAPTMGYITDNRGLGAAFAVSAALTLIALLTLGPSLRRLPAGPAVVPAGEGESVPMP